jgi:hypothetical protein
VTWQERLRARLAKLAGQVAQRVVERLVPRKPKVEPEPESEPEPEPEPKRRATTKKSTPADVEARRLLQEMSSMAEVMAEMRRRLAELGYADAAKGVGVGAGAGAAGGAGGAGGAGAEGGEEERAEAEEEKREEEKRRAEEKRLMTPPAEPDSPFQGHPIHLPFRPVDVMFKTFIFQWHQARIGSVRDETGRPVDPIARFAPFAVARSSPTDPGKVVPIGAFRSADVFREWANENGFSKGLSFRVEGLMVPPGFQRRADTKWVPSAESEASQETGFTFEPLPVSFTPSSVPFDPRTQKGKPGK